MSQFTVFGDEINGYGVAFGDGIVYEADLDTTRKEARRLASFHNKYPNASYEDYLRYKTRKNKIKVQL